MKPTNPNDGAFACAAENGHQKGVTRREWFAAMAMQALVSNPPKSVKNPNFGDQVNPNWLAAEALSFGDALLALIDAEAAKRESAQSGGKQVSNAAPTTKE